MDRSIVPISICSTDFDLPITYPSLELCTTKCLIYIEKVKQLQQYFV